MKRLLALLIFTLNTSLFTLFAAQEFSVSSPDGNLKIVVTNDDALRISILDKGTVLLAPSAIGMQFDGKKFNGDFTHPKKIAQLSKEHFQGQSQNLIYRQAEVKYEYNKLTLNLGGLNLELAAFNEGVAYRFVARKAKGDYVVMSEKAEYAFPEDFKSYLPFTTNIKKQDAMAFQATYNVAPLSKQDNLLAFLPATIDCQTAKLTLMESDVESYPCMFVRPTLNHQVSTLTSYFSHYPKTTDYYAWRKQLYVTSTEDYIAKCSGARTFPWRIFGVTHEDKEMPQNNMVYVLSKKGDIPTDWIKPGRVAWDWWNDWGLQNVPFKAGINMDSYKYYIDFASKNHLEYIILDEGWYNPKSGDMLTTIPEINLPELVEYANKKNVGIILWCVFNVLDDQLLAACEKYSQMGIKGFKVDFLDRSDQTGVEMTYRIADMCAKYHLVLDYHGIYAPTGINFVYPNVINFEAVFGMEEAKWTQRGHDGPVADMPLYDVTFPFVRGQAGFVDFTPGGMKNATKADYQPVYSNPMTMGTRCHQMAHYVIHEAPLLMFADSPSAYEKEPECTHYLATLPASYTSLQCIDGKMGEYIVIARSDKQGYWYVGGETNWTSRDLTIDFSFLPQGKTFKAEMMCDGVNADKVATDWQRQTFTIKSGDTKKVHLASGGGFIIKLK